MSLDPNLGAPSADPTPDPTAGGPGGANADPGASAGASQGTPTPSERTFSQADVDRIVQDRLARDRRDRPAPERTHAAAPSAPPADIPPWAQPLLRQTAVSEVRWTVQQMREQHKDFAANETAILEKAARLAEEHPGLSPTAALRFAYDGFTREQFSKIDIEAEKKKAADEAVKAYLAKKTGTAASTPKPEGPGGTAATASADLKSKDAARQWAVTHLEQAAEA